MSREYSLTSRSASPRSTCQGSTPCGIAPGGELRPLSDPLLAADVELLLPQRHGLLEGVDRLAARLEGSRAVCGRDGDHDARLADLDPADAMVDRDGDQV